MLKPVNPANLTVISGVSVYRMQYVSEDLDGTLLPVTGFIALPNSLPDSRAFPLVAYAHGTFGLYPGCALSNGPNLFDYRSWSLLSERGYAVVATDYAGLGLNVTEDKYCAFPVHAKDVFHSITAARPTTAAGACQDASTRECTKVTKHPFDYANVKAAPGIDLSGW